MKKMIYVLVLPVIAVSGLVFTFGQFGLKSSCSFAPCGNSKVETCDIQNETSKKSILKPLSVAEKEASRKKWEASPDGVLYKKWESSPAGQKVNASVAIISKSIREFTNMEGVITSLSLPPGSRLGFGMMIRINGEDYILAFGAEESNKNIVNFKNKFKQLHNLKVNDKIIMKSHYVSKSPKYAYPIITCDYAEQDSEIIYKRLPRKGGC